MIHPSQLKNSEQRIHNREFWMLEDEIDHKLEKADFDSDGKLRVCVQTAYGNGVTDRIIAAYSEFYDVTSSSPPGGGTNIYINYPKKLN